jgi:hypothetical protein
VSRYLVDGVAPDGRILMFRWLWASSKKAARKRCERKRRFRGLKLKVHKCS